MVGLRPHCHAKASRKATYWGEVGNARRPNWKDRQLLLGGQYSTKYAAVTTWGSVFSKPFPKPSQTAQIGGVMPRINLLE